jgi:hypothetical protein
MSPGAFTQDFRRREREVIRAAELSRQLREARARRKRPAKPSGDIDAGVEILTSPNDG